MAKSNKVFKARRKAATRRGEVSRAVQATHMIYSSVLVIRMHLSQSRRRYTRAKHEHKYFGAQVLRNTPPRYVCSMVSEEAPPKPF